MISLLKDIHLTRQLKDFKDLARFGRTGFISLKDISLYQKTLI
jgi:hypothetical protein